MNEQSSGTEIDCQIFQTASHWGTYKVSVKDGKVDGILDFEMDPDPNPIALGIVDAIDCPSRIRSPMVRKSYLEAGGPAAPELRGREGFVPVSWEKALELTAQQIQGVIRDYGNKAIFGGAYGWASAGRFHHAQSQIHRFLNCIGGYVRSETAYSNAAARIILPHVVMNMYELFLEQPTIEDVADGAELVVAFGGLRVETSFVGGGGVGRHLFQSGLQKCRGAGISFVNISVFQSDCLTELQAEWIAPRPNTDTAFMMGLAHTLVTENLYDREFIKRYTVGFERFTDYLSGRSDGVVKDADWASQITEIKSEEIRSLARRMAKNRTLITCALSLQRADHGEQPIWMTVVLAAMLGQIGNKGCGFGIAFGSDASIGVVTHRNKWPAVPQGKNPVPDFIPVARIADMLLKKEESFDFNGMHYDYPDIKLVYWAGGNPFHHHQDLNRLAEAFRQPDTVVVNEIWGTATARFADIVLPVTSPLEREDICIRGEERTMVAMHQAVDAVGQSRDDFWIFSALAERLGCCATFTGGKTADEWIKGLWRESQSAAAEKGFNIPDYETFREQGAFDLPPPVPIESALERFRKSPAEHPLLTPSGRIEIFCETIDGYDYDDCPGHPVWMEPFEWLGGDATSSYPLHLISNQPKDKLHSQLDMGRVCQATKRHGREPILLHPDDASGRGIVTGDIVEVCNERGRCIAAAEVTDGLRNGVCIISTGAWFDPETTEGANGLCKNGNPNVLTKDVGCSKLSQGPSPMTCLVEVRKIDASNVSAVSAYREL